MSVVHRNGLQVFREIIRCGFMDTLLDDTKIFSGFFHALKGRTRTMECEIIYKGETCRQLNNHFGEHLCNVGRKDNEKEHKVEHSNTNVLRYFNLDGHSTDDMVVLGLLFADKNSTKRKTLENRIIFKLVTLHKECDTSKLLASVHTILGRFANRKKFYGNKHVAISLTLCQRNVCTP